MISTGRCARVSYLTHFGTRDPDADLQLAIKLKKAGHMSPFEHVATPSYNANSLSNFVGWLQFRKTILGESCFSQETDISM